ncbi:MAG: class I SAM-dependent methyltransferase [Thermodesulfobacteriota bacterium]
MFFSERIKSIKPDDRVLEIGPGGSPHPKADILLEYDFKDQKVSEAQRGYAPELKTDKKVVFYDGTVFPFKDKEFDYVICSHVLEHVEDMDAFIAEINRVGRAGYFEYPTIYYDFVYNISEHLNFLRRHDNCIVWMPKKDTGLPAFKSVNAFFYETLEKRYNMLINELKEYFFEGFEWVGRIDSRRTCNIEELVLHNIELPVRERRKKNFLHKLKRIFKLQSDR